MSAFTWLNDLMLWVAKWIPRLILVRVTHRGILFQRAGKVTNLPPGLWWYWPIVTEYVDISILERSSVTSAQFIDNEVIVVTIIWRVVDAESAVTRWRNLEGRIENESRMAVVKYSANMEEVTKQLKQCFEPYIEIIQCEITSKGKAFALKQFSDWASHDTSLPEFKNGR